MKTALLASGVPVAYFTVLNSVVNPVVSTWGSHSDQGMWLVTVLVPMSLRARTKYCDYAVGLHSGTNELFGEDLDVVIRLDEPLSLDGRSLVIEMNIVATGLSFYTPLGTVSPLPAMCACLCSILPR